MAATRTTHLNEQERRAGSADFDYAVLSDGDAEIARIVADLEGKPA